MLVLLFLGAWVSFGFSYEVMYFGDTFRIRVSKKVQTIELTSDYVATAVWNRGDPSASENSRQRLEGSYYVIDKVTQKDSGAYRLKDKDDRVLGVKTLEVKSHSRHEVRNPGDHITIEFDLEPESCNIYFISDGRYEAEMVRRGRMGDRYTYGCTGFEVEYGCRIDNYNLPMDCNGLFEVRDQDGNKAIEITLDMEDLSTLSSAVDASHIGIGVGVSLGVLCCCTCMRRCCCKKSSKKNEAESPDAEPADNYPTYDREPSGPRRDQISQPSETLYPTLPSYNPSSPLIHNPPPTSVPPAYSEVSPPIEQVVAPTFPVPSEDPGPRFELSIPSALPLSSDSTFSHVYTSDKLNF